MALFESLLLDPAPFEVWIAKRTDGCWARGRSTTRGTAARRLALTVFSVIAGELADDQRTFALRRRSSRSSLSGIRNGPSMVSSSWSCPSFAIVNVRGKRTD